VAGGRLLEELRARLLDPGVTRNLDPDEMRKEIRRRGLDVVLGGEWRSRLPASLELADSLLEEVAAGLEEAGYDVVDLLFRLDSMGLTGAGSGVFKAVFEVGLEMDWLLGLPVLRGSTLKGAVRDALEGIVGGECIEELFGAPGEGGGIGAVFFADSYPVGCEKGKACLVLAGDVVTPHYFLPGERRLARAEYEAQPTPVQHVAIAPGTVFRVVAGVPGASTGGERLDACTRNILESLGVEEAPGVPARLQALAAALYTALATGFGARSGKGYNVLLPAGGDEIERGGKVSIVSLKIATSNVQKGERRSHGQGPGGPRRPRRGRWRR